MIYFSGVLSTLCCSSHAVKSTGWARLKSSFTWEAFSRGARLQPPTVEKLNANQRTGGRAAPGRAALKAHQQDLTCWCFATRHEHRMYSSLTETGVGVWVQSIIFSPKVQVYANFTLADIFPDVDQSFFAYVSVSLRVTLQSQCVVQKAVSLCWVLFIQVKYVSLSLLSLFASN